MLVPCSPEALLTQVYGSDWRRPVNSAWRWNESAPNTQDLGTIPGFASHLSEPYDVSELLISGFFRGTEARRSYGRNPALNPPSPEKDKRLIAEFLVSQRNATRHPKYDPSCFL